MKGNVEIETLELKKKNISSNIESCIIEIENVKYG